jgi:hypothetical protein
MISLSTAVGGVTANEPVQTFLLEVPAGCVKLEASGLSPSCSAIMCDSAHKATLEEVRCPAMAGGRKGNKAITCTVSIRKHGIKRVPFCSETLAKLLISKTILQVITYDIFTWMNEVRQEARNYRILRMNIYKNYFIIADRAGK